MPPTKGHPVLESSIPERLPLRQFRNGSLNAYRLLGDRMHKLHPAGEQRDAAVGIAAFGTILQVALDRTADAGELAAYLMVTAGEQLHFQKMVLVSASDVLVIQLCQFRVRPSCGNNV